MSWYNTYEGKEYLRDKRKDAIYSIAFIVCSFVFLYVVTR